MVIYLSSKNIAVMSAKTRGKKGIHAGKHAVFPMPEGAVLNGVITDEESLYDAFKPVLERFPEMKEAALVLDTTHIIYRISALPRTSKGNMVKLVKNEFANRSMADKEYIYDYSVLPTKRLEKNKQLVMACALDRTIIDSYSAFFRRHGVKLTKIDFSINALLQTFYTQGTFDDTSAIVCIVDHYIVSIIDFTKKGEVYFHRSRIISTEADAGYFTEIGDVLYSFMQSRKSAGRDIKADLLCVFDTNIEASEQYTELADRFDFAEVKAGAAAVLPLTGIEAESADTYIYNLCASTPREGKDLNLLKYRVKNEKQEKVKKKRRLVSVFSVVLGVVLALFAFWLYTTWYDIEGMRARSAEMQEFILSPQTIERLGEFNHLSAERDRLRGEITAHSAHSTLVMTTPIAVSEVVLDAMAKFGVRAAFYSINFTADGGVGHLEFNISLENPAEISFFVARLRESGMFEDILYTGYGLQGGRYNFNITAIVRELKPID